jgi:uncharacterized integral membrane protein
LTKSVGARPRRPVERRIEIAHGRVLPRVNDRDDADHVSTLDTARGVGHLVRIGVVVAIVVALVALALDNTDEVRVGFVFGDFDTPLWAVIVISAAAGVILGWLIRHRRRHSK